QRGLFDAYIVIISAPGVGLSIFPVRFITKRFIGDYDPTLEMIYRHTAVIDGEMVHFEILDTAGQVWFCMPHLLSSKERHRKGQAKCLRS
uniref:small monomeric GTPase n=1 Tax=Varanus komodoensis TaxID=61221 RepID=A0A8D2JAF8_VARKO